MGHRTVSNSCNNFFIPLIFLFILLGCNSKVEKNFPEKSSKEIIEIQKTLKKQEVLLERLQALIADQIIHNNDIERAIPPRDLLESLQKSFDEFQEKTKALEKKVSLLQKNIAKNEIKKRDHKSFDEDVDSHQRQIILGLISVQAGNPDQAKEHWGKIVSDKKPTKLKGEMLMAVGHSFLFQGYAKQAASHYGIFLREYPKSPHVPQALYFLGDAMGMLLEKEKQKILWKDLIDKFPKSNFSERARKRLTKNDESK